MIHSHAPRLVEGHASGPVVGAGNSRYLGATGLALALAFASSGWASDPPALDASMQPIAKARQKGDKKENEELLALPALPVSSTGLAEPSADRTGPEYPAGTSSETGRGVAGIEGLDVDNSALVDLTGERVGAAAAGIGETATNLLRTESRP